MTNKPGNLLSRIFRNNWVITLTATLIGVFAALYLNEVVASRKLDQQKTIASENILKEITSNQEKLNNAVEKHINLVKILDFMSKFADLEEETLITHTDTMKVFQMNHPNTFMVKDSTLIEDQIYDYNGTLTLDFTIPQLEITTIAWNTLKDSGVSASYGFECLMYLEGIYKTTDEVSKRNADLMEFFMGSKESGDKNEILIAHVKLLIDFEVSLVSMLDLHKEEMKNCH